ncbi:MAG: PorV/PorQ family protein, partial [bacterium]
MDVKQPLAIALVAIILLGWVNTTLYADGAGTVGASFLRTKAGPRASAMGGAYTALADGGYGMYWNPAGMSRLRSSTFSATHQEQLFEVKNELMSVAIPMGSAHTMGISTRFLYTQYQFRTERQDKSTFTNYNASLAGNYAYGHRTGLAWGIGVKAIQEKLANIRANSFAVDGGIHYQSPRTPLKLAAVVQNVGPEIKFIEEGDPLPRTFRAGWAYDFYLWERRLTFSNDVIYFQPEDITTSSLGLEFKPYPFIALRSGYETNEGFEEDGNFSAGLGVRYRGFLLDYSFTQEQTLSDRHRFSLSVHFGNRRDIPQGIETYNP